MIYSDTLTVTRYSAQTRGSDGRMSAPSVSSTFTIRASVQRPRGAELNKLIDGHSVKDWWWVDTVTALQGADDLTGTPADTLVIDGRTYEVFIDDYERAVILHGEYLVKRVGEGKP